MDSLAQFNEILGWSLNEQDVSAVDTLMVKPAKRGFHPVDIVLFTGLLALSLGIGIYYNFTGGKQKTTTEFLLANRSMRVIPVGISMFMSFASAVLILGNVAEVYTRGAQIFLLGIGATLAQFVSAYLFVPLLFPLKLTSKFVYFEKRFRSKFVRRLGAFLTIVTGIILMGVSMYAPATAMEAVTFFPTWASIILCGIVAMVYTTMGGMKAVIWTDVIQGIVYFGGLLLILILDSFNPDPTIRLTVWSTVFGMFFRALGSALNQTEVQRFLTLNTKEKARNAVLLKAPAMILAFILTVLLGLVVYAYYAKLQCDPLKAGFIRNPNQLLPYFVVHVVNLPGMTGLLLAMLFSGALSTLSSSMNAIATLVWKDFLEEFLPKMDESKKTIITKVIVLITGILAVLFAFFVETLGGHIMQASVSFVGSWSSPIFGLFILGSFFVCANAKGAVVGIITGTAFGMWIAVGSYITKPHRVNLQTDISNCTFPPNTTLPPDPTNPPNVFPLYKVSFLLIPAFSAIVTVAVGLLVSFLTGPSKKKDVEPELLIPFSKRCCCCLRPKRVLCGCNEYQQDDDLQNGNNEEKSAGTYQLEGKEALSNGYHSGQDPEKQGSTYPFTAPPEVQKGHLNEAFASTHM